MTWGESEPLDKAKKLDIHLKELQARIKRLEEIGRAKAKELEKVQKDFKRELKGVEPLAALIEQLQHEEQHLIRRSQGLEDRVIGQFVYDVKSLSSTLEGQASSSIKKWIETPDLDGNGVRGEDYGVTAVQLEVTWSPDCSEYATRLCNIGNLYRIFGDRMSARTVGVCNEYKKLEINYNLAESHLEASRTVMERAKSIAPPKTMTDLQAERAKQRGEVHDSSKDVVKVDGKESEEYCVVLENLSLLHHARGLGITFPKGTPESVKAQAEGQRQKSNRTAVALLEECMVLRARLMGAESDEYLRLVRILAEFHAETKVSRNDSLEPWEKLDLNYPDALPVQEQALQLSKKLHGDKSAQASADLEKLSQLHLRLGKAGVRKGSHGSWVIDPAESWHWDMVSQVARKVCKSSITTHDHTGREAKLLQSHAESILKERTRILNPPPITDYSDPKDEDPLLKKAKVLPCHLSACVLMFDRSHGFFFMHFRVAYCDAACLLSWRVFVLSRLFSRYAIYYMSFAYSTRPVTY